MEVVNRVDYASAQLDDVEDSVGTVIKQSVTQGLNDGALVTFRIPRDNESYTDLNSILLQVEFYIVKRASGVEAAVTDTDNVLLDVGGIHSFFSSCDVRFNGELMSTMTAYPYSSALQRYLGTGKAVREGVWDEVDGTWPPTNLRQSLVRTADDTGLFDKAKKLALGRTKLTGRLYSDILASSRQYLPPGVELGIDLRRAPDAFTIASSKDVPAGTTFSVRLASVSVLARRLHLRPVLHNAVVENMKQQSPHIVFNRLETRVSVVGNGLGGYQWLDCLNGAPLPNRIYIGLVSQKGFFGHMNKIGPYFEGENLKSLNVKLNGRDLLVEPITAKFEYEAGTKSLKLSDSDGKAGFLSLVGAMDQVSDQTGSLRLSYTEYMSGSTLYAIELGKCGNKSDSCTG